MSARYRRYEILIPLQFNDGSPVPNSLIAQTLIELRQRFGAISRGTQTIRGQWEYEGQVYRDDHFSVFIDVEDSRENHEFFVRFKTVLGERFAQNDIWLTSHPIEVL